MKKYTLTFTNNETGETGTTDCEGFFMTGKVDDERSDETIQDMSLTMIAASIAASEELRQAARIAVAMMDAVAYERQRANPIASAIIQTIKDR